MAVKLADAVAYLRADNDQLKKDMRESETVMQNSGSRFGSVLQGIGMSVGLGLANIAADAVGGVVTFMGDSVRAASDMGETVSKTNVLFGASAAGLLAWAETAATTIGQSKQQALDAATTFATFGRAAGLAGDDLVSFSSEFVGLASDLASFNNTSPEDAIQAIGAALRGEAEPMRRYGVLLDDATLKAEAMKLGIFDGTGALTAQQKVLAAQAAIYAQTSAAQGDFARTSGGLANQQRVLDAQMANLKATIGEALLPIVLSLVSVLNNLVQAVLPPLTGFIRNQVMPVMTALGDVINRILGPAVAAISRAFQGLGGTLEQQRNGPLAYLGRWFAENMPRIQLLVERVVGAITGFWEAHGERIMAVVRPLLEWLIAFWDTQLRTLLDIVTALLQVLTGDFSGAGETLRGIWNRWWEFLSTTFTNMRDGIINFFASVNWPELGRTIVVGIATGLRNAAVFVVTATQDVGAGIGNWFQSIDWLALGRTIVVGIATGVANAASLLWSGTSTAGAQIANWFQSVDWGALGWAVLQAIGAGLLGSGRFLYDTANTIGSGIGEWFTAVDWGAIGTAIVQGIGAGIMNSGSWLQQQVSNAAQSALDAAKNALGIRSPSTVAAEQIGVPFVEGIGVGLQRALGDLSGSIAAGMSSLAAGARAGPLQPIAVTLNIYGGDAATVGGAARDGVLAGLRAAGWR